VRASNKYHDGPAKLKAKLLKRGVGGPDAALLLHRHFGQILAKIPDHMRYVQFAITMNALPTGRRTRALPDVETWTGPCPACGEGEYHITHMYGHCRVVALARAGFADHARVPLGNHDLLAASTLHASHLIFDNANPQSQMQVNALVVLNWATWLCFAKYFAPAASDPAVTTDSAKAARIRNTALVAWEAARKRSWPAATRPGGVRFRGPAGLGASGTRSAEQAARARLDCALAIESAPYDAVIAFTDGAAKPNPGPCGAGAVVYRPLDGPVTDPIAPSSPPLHQPGHPEPRPTPHTDSLTQQEPISICAPLGDG